MQVRSVRAWLFRQILIAGAMVLAPAAFAQAPATNAASVADTPPVLLRHPTVTDTSHLQSGDTAVTLFGIKGWGGDPAHGLQSFIAGNGDSVTCRPHDGGRYTCKLPNGLDVAELALTNGAAETAQDAPAGYRQQETLAQSERIGIWVSLPPAPVRVDQPVFETTAVMVGNGRVFVLDGLVGFAAKFYTKQLQNYVATHGNHLNCQERSDHHRYVCVLPDGTDIAAVALTNGLARVSADANEQYRADQAKAIASKVGFWFSGPAEAGGTTIPVVPEMPGCCVIPPGDVGEGIVYPDGVPVAVIGNQAVFFAYAGVLGFGFFDVHRHWHPAAAPYVAHLERVHPDGTGLRSLSVASPARAQLAFHAPSVEAPSTVRSDRLPAAQVFNGPRVMGGAVPFHAPRVASATAEPFNTPGGFSRPSVVTPRGLGARRFVSGQNFVPTPFRALDQPHFAPRPGFARPGEFHPGVIAPPAFASPGVIGRR